MPDYLPGARVLVTTGRFARYTGTIQQPPGKHWPDANGYVGVLLNDAKPKDAGPKLFTTSQLNLI